MAYTFRDFAFQCYRLVNASNPVLALHGDDENLLLQVLNQLINSYAATGLMLTIAQTTSCPLAIGQEEVIVAAPTFLPTPDIPLGRLANLDSAWLLLSGVTYPMIKKSRDEFLAAWKYDPLQGLPRFIITFPETDFVSLRIYPAPSQFFELFIRGKFQLADLDKDSDMSGFPQYYIRYLLFACARDVCLFKGRADAWTEKLENTYQEAKQIMEAASEVNLSIAGDEQSLLNGAWRVRAGI